MVSGTGKLRFFSDVWKKFTCDPWILQTISGYKIEFDSYPIQEHIPKEIYFSDSEIDIVNQEIQLLLLKGAIIQSEYEHGQFVSNIFIVPKPNGKFRPVINLKYLNYFVTYEHFKQETFSVILDLIQENDFFTSIDLKDAYFSIPIHEDFQKYLKFFWGGQLYKFVCLPFGLASAPRIYTKVLRPVYAWFRKQGFRCSYYIDDSLNMNKDRDVCMSNALKISETLQSLGYTINKEKSVFIPTQRIIFFGFIIDSVLFKVFLPEKKVQKIISLAKCLLIRGTVVVRLLASFIGLIINAFYAVLEAPLHYRALEHDKVAGLGISRDFDRYITLSESSVSELNWWINNVDKKNGKLIRQKKSTVTVQTDASLQGWGGFDVESQTSTGGRWTLSESENTINYLELLAICYTLKAFCSEKVDIHVTIQSDNTSAVAYINNMGGMASVQMDMLARQLWEWCIGRNIFISATHLSGSLNYQADFSSRNFSDSTEWMLKKELFDRICDQFFTPDIDLFASRLNYQVDKFVSWFPEPGCFKSDAFSFSWGNFIPYIFPPFNLISKVLNKIVQDRVSKAILIVPHWPSQAWFPVLLSMLISYPVRIPRHKDVLTLPHDGQNHPMGRNLSLVALLVSGIFSRREDFQRQLSTLFFHPGVKEQRNSTVWLGECGVFGVSNGKVIRFVRLR